MQKQLMWESCDWIDDEDLEDEDDDKYNDGYEESGVIKLLQMRHEEIIPTPFGPVNMSDVSSPIHNTKFFIGHLNFNLSKSVIMTINDVPGVEFLKIMSRYRFLIGVGLMFQPLDVQKMIEQKLGVFVSDELEKAMTVEQLGQDDDEEEQENNEVQSAIDEVLSTVTKDSKWIAYVFPNGEHIIKVANTDEEIQSKKAEFEELANLSHGLVMCYND
jgi:hypothetical protein